MSGSKPHCAQNVQRGAAGGVPDARGLWGNHTQYDSLNRLIAASTNTAAWGLTFTYDGFGNRWDQTVAIGTGPSMNIQFTQATNRISTGGYGYDANGNMATINSAAATFDVDNRMLTHGATEEYGYLADNKRTWKSRSGVEQYYLYGVGGQRILTYSATYTGGTLALSSPKMDVSFGGRLIRVNGTAIVSDRLGSVATRSTGSATVEQHEYFPFGEERASPASAGDRAKFGTYHRDQTGLDYADQRFYNSAIGRFLSSDPYEASGGAGEPRSWHRGSYVENDPANRTDPRGLESCDADFCITHTGKMPVTFTFDWVKAFGYSIISDWMFPKDGNEGEKDDKREGIERFLRAQACSASPSARITSVSVGAGFLGTSQVTAELLINYNTGQASMFLGAGVQMGFNPAGASGAISGGFVYGLGVNSADYLNMSRSISVGGPSGVGIVVADNAAKLFDGVGASTMQSVAIQFGQGLNSLKFISETFKRWGQYAGGLGPQGNVPMEFGLGSVMYPNGLPTPLGLGLGLAQPMSGFDSTFFRLRQDCLSEGLIRI